MPKIIHITPNSVFISDFISFVHRHFDNNDHRYYLYIKKNEKKIIENDSDILSVNYTLSVSLIGYINWLKLLVDINRSDKIILHGLNESMSILLLFMMPWNLGKCYWFSWGSDIYKYQQNDLRLKLRVLLFFKKSVVRRMGAVVATLRGEYRNIKNVFGAEGEWYRCFKYPSNLFKDQPQLNNDGVINKCEDRHNGLTILLGNSADPLNNHEEVLKRLKGLSERESQLDIATIFCPLSYGDELHAGRVMKLGKELFGDVFQPLTEFMPLDRYLGILSAVDIAIFNQERQQGMGNIITLLGFGKKVFIREETTSWEFFSEMGIEVYSVNQLEFSRIDPQTAERNRQFVKDYFSEKRLKQELKTVFES